MEYQANQLFSLHLSHSCTQVCIKMMASITDYFIGTGHESQVIISNCIGWVHIVHPSISLWMSSDMHLVKLILWVRKKGRELCSSGSLHSRNLVCINVSKKQTNREDFSWSFQHCDRAQCSEALLPEITVCNVIGPHICWGPWRAEAAATVHRPSHTGPGSLVQLVIASRISCLHESQCLIVLEIKFLQQAEKTWNRS